MPFLGAPARMPFLGVPREYPRVHPMSLSLPRAALSSKRHAHTLKCTHTHATHTNTHARRRARMHTRTDPHASTQASTHAHTRRHARTRVRASALKDVQRRAIGCAAFGSRVIGHSCGGESAPSTDDVQSARREKARTKLRATRALRSGFIADLVRIQRGLCGFSAD
jgi:hypothetical protein